MALAQAKIIASTSFGTTEQLKEEGLKAPLFFARLPSRVGIGHPSNIINLYQPWRKRMSEELLVLIMPPLLLVAVFVVWACTKLPTGCERCPRSDRCGGGHG
jgi:hypothetical protein